MDTETTIFFSGCGIQLLITIICIRIINRISIRYSHNYTILQKLDKYICDTLISCIITVIGYALFTGMIIENIVKYKVIVSIFLLSFISGIHIMFQYMYICRIREEIHEEIRIAPYVNIPETPSPISITTHIQTPTHRLTCNITHYNNTSPPITIINPDGSVNIASIEK